MDRRHFLQAIGGVLAAIGAGQLFQHERAQVAALDVSSPVEQVVTPLKPLSDNAVYHTEYGWIDQEPIELASDDALQVTITSITA